MGRQSSLPGPAARYPSLVLVLHLLLHSLPPVLHLQHPAILSLSLTNHHHLLPRNWAALSLSLSEVGTEKQAISHLRTCLVNSQSVSLSSYWISAVRCTAVGAVVCSLAALYWELTLFDTLTPPPTLCMTMTQRTKLTRLTQSTFRIRTELLICFRFVFCRPCFIIKKWELNMPGTGTGGTLDHQISTLAGAIIW